MNDPAQGEKTIGNHFHVFEKKARAASPFPAQARKGKKKGNIKLSSKHWRRDVFWR